MVQSLEIVLNVAIAVFIAGALLTAGLEVTLAEVIEPLRDRSNVARAVLTNVALTPLFVYTMSIWFPLERPYAIGILLYGFAAGAPYTPRLVAVAKGDVSSSIGLTILLTVLTIAYMPVVLPFLVPGAEIGIWQIALPLFFQMLVPLVVGIAIRHAKPAVAEKMRAPANRVVNSSAVTFLVLAVALHHGELAATFGKGVITSAVLLTAVAFGLGFGLAAPRLRDRVTLGLTTTARNIGAAATIATANFGNDRRVLISVAMCMFVVFALAFPIARVVLAKRLREA